MNGEERPFKRRRMTILMLPDDLLFNCLARISRLCYPTLSLAAIVGSNIHAIGGLVNKNASSSVMVMDCHSHTWREAPSMLMARSFNFLSRPRRPKLGSSCRSLARRYLDLKYKSVEYEGSVYVKYEAKDATYKLAKGRWRTADLAINKGWGTSSSHYCVIENVFYRYNNRRIEWCDSDKRLWTTLKGLEKLLISHVNLVNYGGKMAVVWVEYAYGKKDEETKIWCAEIAIEKREKREIWGMVKWFDIVFRTNEPYHFAHVLATTV
ncbi:unnamed protein product [Arabidopsis lyrata]|nr:unnamed protein product [Arabidopsis lyrata]